MVKGDDCASGSSDAEAARGHFFLAEQRMLHMRSEGAQPHPPDFGAGAGAGLGPGAGPVEGPVFFVVVPPPEVLTGAFVA